MTAGRQPILIAHRGASGYLPEHTLAAYALAVVQGADFIEPDLVSTQDGVLVARHENEIGATTDVASHPEFAARRRGQQIDGVQVTGWFTEDFTLAELKMLRARERIPALRPNNQLQDGRLEIPTFDEILAYLAEVNSTRARAELAPIGVYPETKHPTHFAALGLALEPRLLDALKNGLGSAPIYIQCFEMGNLRQLRRLCEYPLVQLMMAQGGPWDLVRDGVSYADMARAEGMRQIAGYASAIGVQKDMVIATAADGGLQPTPLVRDAHAAQLDVHVWTFRAENCFLPHAMQKGPDAASHGDLGAEIRMHLAAGVDGLFCDFPDLARGVLSRFAAGAAMA